MAFDVTKHPHTRYNPLRDEWVLVSPQRTQRPWMGEKDRRLDEVRMPDNNPLAPGAVRPSGERNPPYTSTWWFVNDFPALFEDGPEPAELSFEPAFEAAEGTPPTAAVDSSTDGDLFRMGTGRGRCEVLCFHPDPSLTLATMSYAEIEAVIAAWIERYGELSKRFTWVQLFENRGAGSSIPHPHGQIWSSMFLPNEIRLKERTQRAYFDKHGRPLLLDYVERELARRERVVCETAHFVAIVPFWAVWPYETMLVPKRHVQEIVDLTADERKDLAVCMKRLLVKYDNLFECDFPYSMGWHGRRGAHWQLHAMYLPPLLRSATVKKHLVGYELLAQVQRDLNPETAAATLRALDGEVHYRRKRAEEAGKP